MTQLHILAATTDGWTLHTGPVDADEGTAIADRHLAPNGWTHRLLPLTPMDRALKHFTAGNHPQPVEGADLFVALRRAIVCDREHDGPDCRRTATLIAHLDAHRPLTLVTGDEECLLGECDHDRDDGACPSAEPAERLCAACTATLDPGGEYGPEWLDACRVEWPCQIVRQVAAYYAVALDEWETPTPTETR